MVKVCVRLVVYEVLFSGEEEDCSGRWKAGMSHIHPKGKDPRWNFNRISRLRSRIRSGDPSDEDCDMR